MRNGQRPGPGWPQQWKRCAQIQTLPPPAAASRACREFDKQAALRREGRRKHLNHTQSRDGLPREGKNKRVLITGQNRIGVFRMVKLAPKPFGTLIC